MKLYNFIIFYYYFSVNCILCIYVQQILPEFLNVPSFSFSIPKRHYMMLKNIDKKTVRQEYQPCELMRTFSFCHRLFVVFHIMVERFCCHNFYAKEEGILLVMVSIRLFRVCNKSQTI